MKSNPLAGITRPSLPTLSDIQRRTAELRGAQQRTPQTQLQTRPALSTPTPPSESPNPILGDAALYGVAGLAVCGLAPHSEAHPAVLDCSPFIGLPHLQAALAVWDYCSASASLFFGTSTGDHTADRILEAINASAGGFLSRKQMSALFHGHLSSSRIEAALEQLISLGAIYQTSQPGGGHPSTLWSGTPESECLAEGESHDESTFEETANQESMQEQT